VLHEPSHLAPRPSRGADFHHFNVVLLTETTSRPPGTTRGSPHSASSEGGPNKRLTTPAADSLHSPSLARSSARAWRTDTRSTSSTAITANRAVSHRWALESTKMTVVRGSKPARCIPGTPTPEPRSTSSSGGLTRHAAGMYPAAWSRIRAIGPAIRPLDRGTFQARSSR